MLGAMIGDMVGAPYEFDRSPKKVDFGPLFIRGSVFTDDTVMTVAVAKALLDTGKDAAKEEILSAITKEMQAFGRRYPNAGYGGRFIGWLYEDDPKPYNSFGNGSAMRCSAAGWLCDSMEETRYLARLTAEPTHNHPEGIKGAEAVCAVIFLARTGHTKEEIRDYVVKEFHYDLSRSCDEIRPTYRHVESCQETVPEAIEAFLEGEDFEGVLRLAVSLGGDCDTLTDIACAMAEGMYEIPETIRKETLSREPGEFKEVLARFEKVKKNRVR